MHAAEEARKVDDNIIFMAALRSRCGHYIFALWFFIAALWNRAVHYIFILWFLLLLLLLLLLLSFYLSFFPRLFSAVAHWMSTILPCEFRTHV